MTIISTDTPGTVVTSDTNETIVIVPDVTVGHVSLVHQGVILINYGRVDSSLSFGPAASGQFINREGGLILEGVNISGAGDVRNEGMIFAQFQQHGISLQAGANFNSIVNTGDIYGLLSGITARTSAAPNVSINNSGDIHSDLNGIWLLNATGAAPVVVNSGTITGRSNSILAEAGDRLNVSNSGRLIGNVTGTSLGQSDSVINNGTITGNVLLGTGNDFYRGVGTVSGSVFGEDGTDNLAGGGAIDRLNGGAGADTLAGNAGNDVLNGGANNDKLFGGAGIDTLTGGTNLDTFVFNTAPNAVTNRDIINDFSHADDTFHLENAVFTKLGAQAGVHQLNPAVFRAGAVALDANDYIVYNKVNGVLYYDTNANAAGGAIAIAVLANKPILAANDFVVI
jgi:Ca2+-binding RTX toxin-like protein